MNALDRYDEWNMDRQKKWPLAIHTRWDSFSNAVLVADFEDGYAVRPGEIESWVLSSDNEHT